MSPYRFSTEHLRRSVLSGPQAAFGIALATFGQNRRTSLRCLAVNTALG